MPEKEMDLLSKVMLRVHKEWTEGKLDPKPEKPETPATARRLPRPPDSQGSPNPAATPPPPKDRYRRSDHRT